MSTRARKAAAGLAMIAVCVPLSSAIGAGTTKTYPTYLLVSSVGAAGANGKINSTKAACKAGRKVQVVKNDSQVAGSDTTDGAGNWAISASLGDTGFAQIVVKQKTKSFQKNGKLHRQICNEVRSAHYPL